ncbi:CmpA/NrtA family ABC transporter substrate-binding protein [Phormidium tenue]|uniref:Bicarbonate-binding protein n=1 Tax=Phormidium tenue NIES-30 TaxID=549789 RepID=A0A1U7J6Q7_9CYAN|nr:CmpA/NrtA family ABC transporter substrate-binding protein [Phormidium tenue]MBD2233550.1 ABC transporter substrate-binding protein [Phormidium tenue FACHB-1052]OKH48658.1 bicarbonate-binding protein [Phormidium tenue NIES-30]
MTRLNRRRFLMTAGTAAAGTVLLHACSQGESDSASSDTPTAAPANSSEAPETTTAKLGFIALTDSAPLIIAKVKGFFDKYGMTDVSVEKQASWGTTRDNLVLGSGGGGIDGAHILTPMPYLISEGIVTDGKKVPMYILARLNTNGQGISLSNDYLDLKVTKDSTPLKEVFAKRKAEGKELKAAVTFPGGTHDLWMRYWLAAGGIDPDQDISTIVVPPPQMVANIKVGNMDAFCVGEPWPLQLVNQKIGYNALTTGELWKDHPEKALGMRADWVDANPKAAKALLMGALEGAMWCDQPENKEEMCQILSERAWFNVPVSDIIDRSQGKFDFGTDRVEELPDLMQKYWADNASYPFKSHDLWFLTENIRWGKLPADTDTKAWVDAVNREDLWREAATALGQEAMIPKSTSRGVETFFDGVTFDPENPQAYLDSLKIKRV